MRIKFIKTRTVRGADGETFEAGKEYDLLESSANHWIRRGVAVEVEVKSVDAPPANKMIASPARKKALVTNG